MLHFNNFPNGTISSVEDNEHNFFIIESENCYIQELLNQFRHDLYNISTLQLPPEDEEYLTKLESKAIPLRTWKQTDYYVNKFIFF